MKQRSESERKNWIDVLRAFAMIAVIYGHLLEKTDHSYIYYVFTSPVKIPLFFAISGYLFKETADLYSFLKKVFRGLAIPWLVLSIVPIILVSILKGGNYLVSNLIAIFSGVSVWYMPCCIIAEIVFYFILRISRNRHIVTLLISVVLSSVGVLLIKSGILDILMINRAFSAQIFLVLGYYIKRYEGELDKVKSINLWIGCGVYVAIGLLSIYLFPGQNLDVHQGIYYSIPICLMMVILGCVLLFEIGKRFDFRNRVLCFIGRNTLVYYILASYPITVYNALSSKIGMSIDNHYISAAVKSIFVCCLCAVFALFINAILPEAIGKKRRKAGNKS